MTSYSLVVSFGLQRSTALVALCRQQYVQGHRNGRPAADVGEQITCYSGIVYDGHSRSCLPPHLEGQRFISNRKADKLDWLRHGAQTQLAWPMHQCWPRLSDSSAAAGCRDHDDAGSPTSAPAAKDAAPAAAPQERPSSEGKQAAEQDLLAETGSEGLKEPNTAGSSRSRDARLLRIQIAEAAAQEGGGAAAAAASGSAAADSGTDAAEGHGNAATASGTAAAAPEDTSSASGGGSQPATPSQERPASRRSASGSLEAVSAQSGSATIGSQGLEALGMAGPDSGMGPGKSTESPHQPGWSTAEGPQPEPTDSEAAEGGTPEEDEPQ